MELVGKRLDDQLDRRVLLLTRINVGSPLPSTGTCQRLRSPRAELADLETLGSEPPSSGQQRTWHQQAACEQVRLDLDRRPSLAGAADDRRLCWPAEEVPHHLPQLGIAAMQAPMADLVRVAEVEPPAHSRVHVGIERLVNADELLLEVDRTYHVGCFELLAEIVDLELQAKMLQ